MLERCPGYNGSVSVRCSRNSSGYKNPVPSPSLLFMSKDIAALGTLLDNQKSDWQKRWDALQKIETKIRNTDISFTAKDLAGIKIQILAQITDLRSAIITQICKVLVAIVGTSP